MSAAAVSAASGGTGGVSGPQAGPQGGGMEGGGTGNGSIEGGTGNDNAVRSASASWIRSKGRLAAQPQAPAAPARQPRAKAAAPVAPPPQQPQVQPQNQTGDLEDDVDPTSKAYLQDDDFEDGDLTAEDGVQPQADGDLLPGEAAPPDDVDPQASEGGQQTGATLRAIEAMFGLKSGEATPALQDAMMNDVEAVLAQLRGAPQQTDPAAARTPAANGNPQSRPPAPSAPPASGPGQTPAPAPPTQGNGSGEFDLLSDEQIAEMAEYGPAAERLARSHNALASALKNANQQLAQMGALQTQFDQMQAAWQEEQTWATRVRPVVQEFVQAQERQGWPPIPDHELREFANDASAYLEVKRQQGAPITPQQAMFAVYMARKGKDIQSAATQARESGRREVTHSLQRRQRRFDVAGGPGSIPAAPRTANPDAEITRLSRAYRRQATRGG